jgi:type IX secretion system PorP/SprF family membrane protein
MKRIEIHMKRSWGRRVIAGIMGLCPFAMQAQDPHFSQYFASPLTLNPANTGNFDYPARLATNFRSQWQGIGEPYLTGTLSYDAALFRDRLGDRNKFAAGLLGMYDQTTNGLLKGNYAGVSLGYHLTLDEDFTEQLSIGFQAARVSKRLDPNRISFSEQFTGAGFDLSLPSNQRLQSSAINYTDLHAGLMYSKTGERASFYIGASAYHLTRPRESFLGDLSREVDIRWTLHGGGTIWLNDRSQLMGSLQQMSQGGASMQVLGLAYGHYFESEQDISVYAGAWYRHRDAVIPYIGYMYNNFQLGLSYDVTISGLSLARTRNRSMEISVIYHFLDLSEYRRMVPWY